MEEGTGHALLEGGQQLCLHRGMLYTHSTDKPGGLNWVIFYPPIFPSATGMSQMGGNSEHKETRAKVRQRQEDSELVGSSCLK